MHDRFLRNQQVIKVPGWDGRMTKAERELAALFTAVTELFGSEPARLSVEDWLERESLDRFPGAINCDWRPLTMAALLRLAARANASRQFC